MTWEFLPPHVPRRIHRNCSILCRHLDATNSTSECTHFKMTRKKIFNLFIVKNLCMQIWLVLSCVSCFAFDRNYTRSQPPQSSHRCVGKDTFITCQFRNIVYECSSKRFYFIVEDERDANTARCALICSRSVDRVMGSWIIGLPRVSVQV